LAAVINEAVVTLGTVINAIVFNIASFVAPATIILAAKIDKKHYVCQCQSRSKPQQIKFQ